MEFAIKEKASADIQMKRQILWYTLEGWTQLILPTLDLEMKA